MSLVDDPNSTSGKRIDYAKNLYWRNYNAMLHERDAEIVRLRTALKRAEQLFDGIAMRYENGPALDGANEIRAILKD